jgi:hypothetical protein
VKAGNAFGGALCIAGGTANISGSFFGAYTLLDGNTAQGGQGYGADGAAYGGAVYVAGGTVTLSADTLGNSPIDPTTGANIGAKANTATGPSLSVTGQGYGGGLDVAGGTVTLTNDTIIYNVAGGAPAGGILIDGSYGSYGTGGGIDIASGATVYLDSFTVANTSSNNPNDIVGTYILRA